MSNDFLFQMEPGRTDRYPGAPDAGECFGGIAGTAGRAMLCPWQQASERVGTVGPDGAWFRCRQVTDSGAKPGVAAAMMLITFAVPADCNAEFEDWYASEHIPMLLKAEGWLRARRFVVTGHSNGAAGWTSIAIHLMTSLDVLDSEERRLARTTPWRARFASLPWFEAAGRFLYQPEWAGGRR